MKKRTLSASSIKTYLQCLLKYYYHYCEKKPRPGATDPLALGTAVHAGLEKMYQIYVETGAAPSPEAYEEVIKVFMDAAAADGLKEMDLYQEGKDMLINRLDNLSLDEKVVGLEKRFSLKTPSGTPITGSIDKLLELDEDTIAVIDYKTSKYAFTQDEADGDIQLSMYDLAVSMMYPQYKNIILALDYVRLKEEAITHRTPEQRALFVEFLDSVYDNIGKLEEKDMAPSLNMFCGWCDYKNYCPSYTKAVTDPDLKMPMLEHLDEDEFVNTWVNFQHVKRAVDNHNKLLKGHAYTRMKGGGSGLVGNTFEIYKVQTSRVNYNPRAVFEVTGPESFVRMVSVSKAAVDKFMQNNPEHADALRESASFSYNAASFRYRKIKNS